MYEWEYQAQGWSRARRVVLVVLERKDELFPHAFWLVTSWSKEQMPAQALLEHYRQRGTAEGHFGELMDVLAPALSSARRPKSKYRGSRPSSARCPSTPSPTTRYACCSMPWPTTWCTPRAC
ncbi:transposase [Archangium violaceum]|nr:transposase [Archangium violaceum]QRK13644.1 transposase [Archangium violaceum]